MVFDIRGRRKHVVRVVYAILAVLMGASLFLVVGPFSIGNLIGNSSSTNAAKILQEQAQRIETKLRREPEDEALLLALARARISAGNALAETNSETGLSEVTAEGRFEYARAVEAWNRYLKQTSSPSASGAQLVAGTYFRLAENSRSLEEAETNVEKAAKTQHIVAEAIPSVGSLTTLAIYEYYDNDFAAGDKATAQAEAKASKGEAKEIKKQLAAYRLQGKRFEEQKKKIAKEEAKSGKESLQNPLGGLGGSAGTLGQ
jgi:hypothetical protein